MALIFGYILALRLGYIWPRDLVLLYESSLTLKYIYLELGMFQTTT